MDSPGRGSASERAACKATRGTTQEFPVNSLMNPHQVALDISMTVKLALHTMQYLSKTRERRLRLRTEDGVSSPWNVIGRSS